MDLINEAAVGGREATTIATAPAPAGEAPIGAREAARTLATWRQQRRKQGPTSADDPSPAQPADAAATPQDGEPPANASDASTPDKEAADAPPNATEADTTTEPPVIEPPKSWSK